MEPKLAVEIADRMSRKRSLVVAFAAGAFLVIQLIARPFFVASSEAARHTQITFWAINAVALLLFLATGGGLLNRKQLRSLVNDEVSRAHTQSAIVAGYWVAMAVAMALYFMQGVYPLTGREVAYVTVSSSLLVSLFMFSYLELRAHRNA